MRYGKSEHAFCTPLKEKGEEEKCDVMRHRDQREKYEMRGKIGCALLIARKPSPSARKYEAG